MRKAGKVYFKDIFAGIVEQGDGEFRFTYDKIYLDMAAAEPISFTMPLRSEPYRDKTMLPFFDGLIPEGWRLTILEKNWKIDIRDRMSLLLTTCQDCIGAVKVIRDENEI
jgi:serine/threonine-protein kinase HipA